MDDFGLDDFVSMEVLQNDVCKLHEFMRAEISHPGAFMVLVSLLSGYVANQFDSDAECTEFSGRVIASIAQHICEYRRVNGGFASYHGVGHA